MPIVQVLLFGFALSNEVRNTPIAIVDNAHDAASEAIIAKIDASGYFTFVHRDKGIDDVTRQFQQEAIRLAVVFPANFYDDLLHLRHNQIQVITDASDPNTATTLNSYVSAIIRDYQLGLSDNSHLPMQILIETRMRYNPQLKGAPNFVPGVMALVLMLICVMMTSISIVREKELGTMEVLLVSPFRPAMVLFSKTVPYLIISIINLTVILLLSVFLLDLTIRGSIVLLFLESILFIITSLSLGLLISTRTSSQQTAMLLSLMGMMLPTLLFTGFMFPIENMPYVLQLVSKLIPAHWYYIIVRDVMIKGLGLAGVWRETLILTIMAFILLVASLKSFKSRLE